MKIAISALLGWASANLMQQTATMQAEAQAGSMTQSHNCNSNIDRIKMGPQNWQQIEGTGLLYHDNGFSADDSILSWKEYPRTVGGLSKYLSWFKEFKRPRDLLRVSSQEHDPNSAKRLSDTHLSLFGSQFETTGTFLSYDLEQGSIGDNYFLTVAAALADRGNFITKLFHQKSYNEEGIFTVRGFVKGHPEDISIDDILPVYSNKPAFAKPTKDGGWWLPLLEKAYAKAHVNYEQISSGSQAEAAQFLTGAPAQEYSTNVYSSEELWLILTSAVRNEYLITAASFTDQNGLVSGNGYVVKDFVLAGGKQLLKMKNPWKAIGDTTMNHLSHGEWTGPFGRFDSAWTPELVQKAAADRLLPGEFYMTVSDFKDSFKYYTIAYLHNGWKNSFVEKRASVNQRLYKFNFTVTEDDYNVMRGACPEQKTNLMVAQRLDEAIDEMDDEILLLDAYDEALGNEELVELTGDGPYIAAEQDEEESDAEIADEQSFENERRTLLKTKALAQQVEEIAADWAPDEDTKQAIANHKVMTDGMPTDEDVFGESLAQKVDCPVRTRNMQVYVGGELYSKRMYPHGCQNFQKAFVKLFRVDHANNKLKLVDSRFFTNREGFGYLMRNLTKGDYQVHFKKYSKGFDVFDFTVRLYGHRSIKIVDDEQLTLDNVEISREVLDKLPTIKDGKAVQDALDTEAKAKNGASAPEPPKEEVKPEPVEEAPKEVPEPKEVPQPPNEEVKPEPLPEPKEETPKPEEVEPKEEQPKEAEPKPEAELPKPEQKVPEKEVVQPAPVAPPKEAEEVKEPEMKEIPKVEQEAEEPKPEIPQPLEHVENDVPVAPKEELQKPAHPKPEFAPKHDTEGQRDYEDGDAVFPMPEEKKVERPAPEFAPKDHVDAPDFDPKVEQAPVVEPQPAQEAPKPEAVPAKVEQVVKPIEEPVKPVEKVEEAPVEVPPKKELQEQPVQDVAPAEEPKEDAAAVKPLPEQPAAQAVEEAKPEPQQPAEQPQDVSPPAATEAPQQIPPVVAPAQEEQPQPTVTQDMLVTDHSVLASKLKKAAVLAENPDNDKMFEIHQQADYFMKDALDKKHGYYFLRVGTNAGSSDLDLNVRMFLAGDQVETSETDEPMDVYQIPASQQSDRQDYRLTTTCKIRPEQGKTSCDYLVPTTHHEKTQVSVINKQAVGQPKPDNMLQQEVAEPIEVPEPVEDAEAEEETPADDEEQMAEQVAAIGQEEPQQAPTAFSEDAQPAAAPMQQLGNFEVSVPALSLPTIEEDNLHAFSMSGEASAKLLDIQERLSRLSMMDKQYEED